MHRDWARSGEELLKPFSENAHLLSALDVETEDVVDGAFGKNLVRLAAVKQKYDPTNFFRVNQNVKPDANRPTLEPARAAGSVPAPA